MADRFVPNGNVPQPQPQAVQMNAWLIEEWNQGPFGAQLPFEDLEVGQQMALMALVRPRTPPPVRRHSEPSTPPHHTSTARRRRIVVTLPNGRVVQRQEPVNIIPPQHRRPEREQPVNLNERPIHRLIPR